MTGLEPAASGVTGQRSNQLSYTPKIAPQETLVKVGVVYFRDGYGEVKTRSMAPDGVTFRSAGQKSDPDFGGAFRLPLVSTILKALLSALHLRALSVAPNGLVWFVPEATTARMPPLCLPPQDTVTEPMR